ncbi:MAG: ABC transporter permease [Candidatus Promineifilaceae bacterium]
MHKQFILRQISTSLKQTLVFIACVALSLVTLVSLGGFGESINNSLLRDARRLLAGDIVVATGFPLREPLVAELNALRQTNGVRVAQTYEFISVVRLAGNDQTLLSELKVVEDGYPFYGDVVLASGASFTDKLRPGTAIVAQNLLDRLDLTVGDVIEVGEGSLQIVDVVSAEPDRPIDFIQLGPRIFIHADDLPVINLIKPGSRIQYRTLLALDDESQLDAVAEQLVNSAEPRLETVETFRNNQSQVQRFFEDFLTFLSLIGIFTLVLAGIGIQTSLAAFLKERESTIAILRTMGATSRFIITQYFAVAVVLGIIGTAIGLLLGLVLQQLFPLLFAPFLPPQVEFVLSLRSILEGILLGIFVISAFTFIPLYQLQELKPTFIFRKERLPVPKSWPYFLALTVIALFFVGMVFWYLRNPERTVYFAGGVVGLVAVAAGLTHLVLVILRRQTIKPLAARQALRGLFRPRNATAAIIITLATALGVLFTIYLLERNLDASFVEAYPDDAPNLFLLDIQPDQRAAVADLTGEPIENFIPLVRVRVATINGVPVTPSTEEREDGGPSFSLDRPFSVSYRDGLLEDERLVEGAELFDVSAEIAQVSIEAEAQERFALALGDVLEFDIQGVVISAEIASVRRANSVDGDFRPRFGFIFRSQDLQAAPQTIVTAITVPDGTSISDLQNRIVAALPNVTVVDVTETISALSGIVADITVIIRFFTIFSLLAGLLIIISSVLATRFARIQEAVYFKVLGAKRRFVLRVFTLENMLIGGVSAFLALLLSQVAGYILIRFVFELDYLPFLGSSVLLVIGTVLLVTLVGLFASVSILQKKPIVFLREQSDD